MVILRIVIILVVIEFVDFRFRVGLRDVGLGWSWDLGTRRIYLLMRV